MTMRGNTKSTPHDDPVDQRNVGFGVMFDPPVQPIFIFEKPKRRIDTLLFAHVHNLSNIAAGTKCPPTAALDVTQGRFDALIAPSFKQTDDLRGVELGSWPWVTFGRKDHPGFVDWSLESWARFPHLQVSSSSPSGRNPIDLAASKLGATRNIGAVVPHFSMAAPILSGTDMLLTVPSIAMHDTAEVYGLARRDLPLEIPPLALSLFHSAKFGDETDIRWFRAHLADAARALIGSE